MTDCSIDCDTLKNRLAAAEASYHALLTGGGKQSVTFGPSKSVTFTAANIGELRRYLNDLREQIAACCGSAAGSIARRAPVRFVF